MCRLPTSAATRCNTVSQVVCTLHVLLMFANLARNTISINCLCLIQMVIFLRMVNNFHHIMGLVSVSSHLEQAG